MPLFKASPLPWRGNKGWASEKVWEALGDPIHYVEPFAGSLAILLTRPGGSGRVETVGDADGFVANFWRAMRSDCEAVERYWGEPPVEVDMLAWHYRLKDESDALADKLACDPRYYDPEIAGRWAHLASWCMRGPMCAQNPSKLKPSTTSGGVVTMRGDGRRNERLAWLRNVQARLSSVRVMFGDWRRTVTDAEFTGTYNGIFLDPPYHLKARAQYNYQAGRSESDPAAGALEWAEQHGSERGMRIVLCAHQNDPADRLADSGWTAWTGRNPVGATSVMRDDRLETLWFSPHCRVGSVSLF